MSSIYRKGRDNYFYYQTYVFNSESGKKDKRVYHSLGTKDRAIALKKKAEYDLKYDNKGHLKKNSFKGIKQYLFIIILIGVSYYFFNTKFSQNGFNKPINNLKNDLRPKENFTSEVVNIEIIDKNEIVNKIDSIIINDKNSDGFDNIKQIDYKLHRTEDLSSNFNQGKLYITVDKNSNSQEIKFLCEIIKEKFSKFTSIIICIYADNETGVLLAKGLKAEINSKDEKSSWLAMFSYNPVEGQYFDDNPGKYIGIY